MQQNFIVANDDVEEEADNSSSASDSDEVDEDDLDLIEANVGIRMKPVHKRKRRLHFADEEDEIGVKKGTEKNSQQIHRQLFSDHPDEDSEEDNEVCEASV